MDAPRTRRSKAVQLATASIAAAALAGAAAGHAGATPAALRAAPPGGSMTRQLPQDITVRVSGRRVTVHFGSLRRRAVRTATIRFTRTSGGSVVRRARASGILRLTAPSGTRRVRLTVPSTREWTSTTITRRVGR